MSTDRCQACRQLVRGGVLVGRPDGKYVGACCAPKRDREIVESMIPVGTPEPVEPPETVTMAHVVDVLGPPLGRKPPIPT